MMPLLPTIIIYPFGTPPMARRSYNTSSSVTTGPQPLYNSLIGMLMVGHPSTIPSMSSPDEAYP
jgi:hypothetical protein